MSVFAFSFEAFYMQLSVIIVNYNVKHFLEQCLFSVQKAIQNMRAEIIVVDNNSTDGSMAYLKPKFANVNFLENKENCGFAKACNQGLNIATGNYILFLNPDTIVPEDCFEKCIQFFTQHADAGALGIRMIDGSGKFLKESKRAFPSPLTSLYKLFGFAKLFPKSKTFSQYHLGHLAQDKANEIDVLAGAFMMIRKEVLDKTGGFDERFFMYGEDVDLSYRIQKSGYKNYYFPDSSIIHFKGESTRKGSMNYVRMFYNAMSVFVKKHYSGGRAGAFNLLIHAGIWLRAIFSATGHFIRRIGLPLIDAVLILLSFLLTKWIWGEWIRPETSFEERLIWIAFPSYTLLYLTAAYYAGLYDRSYKQSGLARSMLFAIIILLAAYSLLPENLRFSRGILLFGSILAFLLITVLRWILIQTGALTELSNNEDSSNILIVGSEEEYAKCSAIIIQAGLKEKILGRVAVSESDTTSMGHFKDLMQLSTTLPFKELIICEGNLTYKDIINIIPAIAKNIKVKLYSSGSNSIVGSDSKDSSGEAVSKENGYNIAHPYYQRMKRLIDVMVSFIGLITFPIQFIIVKKPISFFSNCLSVLSMKKTWIGYISNDKSLPNLRKGVLGCNGTIINTMNFFQTENLKRVDYWYAKEYKPMIDIGLIFKKYRRLGG